MLPQTLDERRRDGELCDQDSDLESNSKARKRKHLNRIAQVGVTLFFMSWNQLRIWSQEDGHGEMPKRIPKPRGIEHYGWWKYWQVRFVV